MKLAPPVVVAVLWLLLFRSARIAAANNVVNDRCVKAQAITLGSTVYADFANATKDPTIYCGDEFLYDPPLWYTFVGTGEPVFGRILDSCQSIDSVHNIIIAVYKGSGCGASELECITTFGASCTSGRVLFETELGVTYYFVVREYDVRQFEFSLYTFTTPTVNDRCENAIPLTIGSTVYDDFSNATADFSDVNVDDCTEKGNSWPPVYPGLWYTFVGTGELLTGQGPICDPFDISIISIYEGGSCDRLKCVAGEDFTCVEIPEWDSDPFFYFRSRVGQTYHVLVQSDQKPHTLTNFSIFPVPKCGLFDMNLFCPSTFQGAFGRWLRQLLWW